MNPSLPVSCLPSGVTPSSSSYHFSPLVTSAVCGSINQMPDHLLVLYNGPTPSPQNLPVPLPLSLRGQLPLSLKGPLLMGLLHPALQPGFCSLITSRGVPLFTRLTMRVLVCSVASSADVRLHKGRTLSLRPVTWCQLGENTSISSTSD